MSIDYPTSHPPEAKCCYCGKAMGYDPEHCGPEDGGLLELSFGYGSPKFDLQNFVALICDDCVVPFINSLKSKVGQYCCMGGGPEHAKSPNCVVDEGYGWKHRQALIDSGVRFATEEDLIEAIGGLASEPEDPKLPECTTPAGDG